MNLSSVSLTTQQEAVLNLGLSFVPVTHYDPFKMRLALHRFFRKLLVTHFCATHDMVGDISIVRPPSRWIPAETPDVLVSAYQKLVLSDLQRLENTVVRTRHYNLSAEQWSAVKQLRDDHSLVIRRADKGGATVIQSYDQYRAHLLDQLNNPAHYVKLADSPFVTLQNTIRALMITALEHNWITKKEFGFLVLKHPKIPFIYTVPKIHKSVTAPPGRPIVSCRGSSLEPLSKFCDKFLQPCAQRG